MKLKGDLRVDAPRDRVWDLLFDVEVLTIVFNKIPGIAIERLVQIAPDKYEAIATIGVAMVKGKYNWVISVVEKRAPEFVRFHGEGKGGGNWTSGDMAITLTTQENQTRMVYDGIGNISGPLASLGQRLIDTVGKQFIQHGTEALAQELNERARAHHA